jgi:hypothetical protein
MMIVRPFAWAATIMLRGMIVFTRKPMTTATVIAIAY